MQKQSPDPLQAPRAPADPLCDLLEAAAGGDVGAFESFYDATVRDVLALARELAGDRLEPLLTASYLQAWHDAAGFDRACGSALDWLLALVRRQAGSGSRGQELSA